MNNLGYQRIPGLEPYTKMRTCREYSSLPPMYKSMWDEYRALRYSKARLTEVLETLSPTKPRFTLVNGRPKRVVHTGPYERVNSELTKTWHRMTELAQYFFAGIRWIAPDFSEDQLKAMMPEGR